MEISKKVSDYLYAIVDSAFDYAESEMDD